MTSFFPANNSNVFYLENNAELITRDDLITLKYLSYEWKWKSDGSLFNSLEMIFNKFAVVSLSL